MNKRLLLTFLAILLLVPAVYSVITIDTPTSAQVVTGTFNFSMSPQTSDEISNLTLLQDSVPFASVVNVSADQQSFSIDFDTTSLTDSASTVINFSVFSDIAGTSINNSATVTVEIDNTAPSSVTLSLQYPFIRKGSLPQVATCSGVDAVDSSVTIGMTLTDTEGTNITQSATSPFEIDRQYTFQPDSGDGYTIHCTATDNANINTSTSQSFSVLNPDEKPDIIKKKEEVRERGDNLLLIASVVAIIVVIAVLLIVTSSSSKKSKKRR